MPTVTSRVPALLDYLFNLFTADVTLGAAPAPNTVTVYDGSFTGELDPFFKLFVGLSDPDSDGAEPAAEFTQEWAAIGRRGRNEQIIIHCCAQAWSGTDDIRTVRVAVYGIVSAVETLMQADTTSFGGNILFPDPGMTSGSLLQNNTSKGAIAQVPFDLTFKARIGG